jgi:competence protein ComGC
MNVLFLLFVISILLLLIFWELSKINTRLKKALGPVQNAGQDSKRALP